MTSVVQRVRRASVTVDGDVVGRIDTGLCVLAAIEANDTEADVVWTANKLATLRVFPDGDKPYHLDVTRIGGSLLLVSNFTVAAATANGRRPGFDRAMKPDAARPAFDRFVERCRDSGVAVATGVFGVDMVVSIDNDGPLTLILQSPKRTEGAR